MKDLKLEDGAPIIVTLSNEAFLPLLQNWIKGASKLSLKNLLLIAIDDAVEEFAKDEGLQYLKHPVSGRNPILHTKTQVVASLLTTGHDVIFTDVDAVWLKDPIPYLSSPEFREKNLLFTQAFGHPLAVVKERGFCVCSGFYLARNSEATKLFFQYWLASQTQLQEHCDQVALNVLLGRGVGEWRFKEKKTLSSNEIYVKNLSLLEGVDCFYSSSPIEGGISLQRGEGQSIPCRLSILPIELFTRGPKMEESDPFVVHLGAGEDVNQKIDEFKSHSPSLWYL